MSNAHSLSRTHRFDRGSAWGPFTLGSPSTRIGSGWAIWADIGVTSALNYREESTVNAWYHRSRTNLDRRGDCHRHRLQDKGWNSTQAAGPGMRCLAC